MNLRRRCSFESASRKRVAYVPAIGKPQRCAARKNRWRGFAFLFRMGTFWSDDELKRLQGQAVRRRHQMGTYSSWKRGLELLKNIKVKRKMFYPPQQTRIRFLNETSSEYQTVRQAGWEVAEDNWQLEL